MTEKPEWFEIADESRRQPGSAKPNRRFGKVALIAAPLLLVGGAIVFAESGNEGDEASAATTSLSNGQISNGSQNNEQVAPENPVISNDSNVQSPASEKNVVTAPKKSESNSKSKIKPSSSIAAPGPLANGAAGVANPQGRHHEGVEGGEHHGEHHGEHQEGTGGGEDD